MCTCTHINTKNKANLIFKVKFEYNVLLWAHRAHGDVATLSAAVFCRESCSTSTERAKAQELPCIWGEQIHGSSCAFR